MATLRSFKFVCVHSGIEVCDYLRLLKLCTKFGIHFSAKPLFRVQNLRTTSKQITEYPLEA